MRVDAFDFDLPEDLIALAPKFPKDMARLLCVDQELIDTQVFQLPALLQPGDLMVFNDTKVIPSDLRGTRVRGQHEAHVRFNLHKKDSPHIWRAFAQPAKRLKQGDHVRFNGTQTLTAQVMARDGAEVVLCFTLSGAALDDAIKAHGAMPLPPYIERRRPADATDEINYQTIYAREEGAVAAPTAGLHFTNRLMYALDAKGIKRMFLTLHVGAGTFLPVLVDDIQDHTMHAEYGVLSQEVADAINQTHAAGNKVIAVGTTSLRLIESATDHDGQVHPFADETDIFISPGYRFKAVDMLMTNFHLPRSTLFMLVSAFCGLDQIRSAYRHAIARKYRFYSYGDASLLTCQNRL